MKINSIGLNYTHNQRFMISRPNGSGDYLLLLVKTPARFIFQGKVITADKNTIIIYDKGSSQYYSAVDSNYTNDFIHFDAEGERELRSLPLNTLLSIPSIKQVSRLIKDIYLEYISNHKNREASMDLLLKLLLIKINELISYKAEDNILLNYYDTLLNLRSMIHRHPEEKWSIIRLSKQANLSPSHFQRLYKQTFGISCITDAIACKIEYAKTSLASTDSTVREISTRCGYENEEHFMRQFKREVGMTPSQYRSKMR
jgi:AraC family transcriptional regulator of arabinose operon